MAQIEIREAHLGQMRRNPLSVAQSVEKRLRLSCQSTPDDSLHAMTLPSNWPPRGLFSSLEQIRGEADDVASLGGSTLGVLERRIAVLHDAQLVERH